MPLVCGPKHMVFIKERSRDAGTRRHFPFCKGRSSLIVPGRPFWETGIKWWWDSVPPVLLTSEHVIASHGVGGLFHHNKFFLNCANWTWMGCAVFLQSVQLSINLDAEVELELLWSEWEFVALSTEASCRNHVKSASEAFRHKQAIEKLLPET